MNRHLSPLGGVRLIGALALVFFATGCGAPQPPSSDATMEWVDQATPAVAADGTKQALQAEIPGLREPRANLFTAGQPKPEAWDAVAESGITTVINLRPHAEMEGRDEAAEVAAAGIAYHQLPVAGAGDVNGANAEQLRRLIEQAPGPVLVHCASGNRVGALLALGAAADGEMTSDDAIAFGRDAGLASLETRVREVLDSRPGAE